MQHHRTRKPRKALRCQECNRVFRRRGDPRPIHVILDELKVKPLPTLERTS